MPQNYGIIIRTSAKEKSEEEIKRDINNLIITWQEIVNKYEKAKKRTTFTPQLIYKNQGIIEKLIRME